MKNARSRSTVTLIGASAVTLIGASVRAAAQSAALAGLQVIGADQFGDRDCRAACKDFVLLREPSDGHITFTARDFVAETLSQSSPWPPHLLVVGGFAQDCQTLDHAGFAASPELIQPAFLAQLASDVGMQFPTTFSADRQSRPHAPARTPDPPQPASARWLWKDLSSCGGLDVRWANPPDAGIPFNNPAPRRSGHPVYQRWIAGKRFGVSYLSDGNTVVRLGTCRSLHTKKAAGPFVYSGSYGPVSLTAPQNRQLDQLGETLVANTQLSGLFGIDVIIDAQSKLWLLEINPRWTASSELIERDLIRRGVLRDRESLIGAACKIHFPTLNPRLSLPSVADLNARIGQSVCHHPPLLKQVIFATRSGKLDCDALLRLCTDSITFHDIPSSETPIVAGHPLCSLIGSGDWRSSCPPWPDLRTVVRAAQAAVC